MSHPRPPRQSNERAIFAALAFLLQFDDGCDLKDARERVKMALALLNRAIIGPEPDE
jgi:hypothetical protein